MDDTEFPEYDPTPYGGGLDLEDLYGKSIQPSDKSCYAPSEPASSLPDAEDDDDKASLISAYGVELPDFGNCQKNPPIEGKLEENGKKKPTNGGEKEEIGKKKPKNGGKEEENVGPPQPWKPIYPTPEYQLRDSDLLLPICTCATPNQCTCPYNIFSFNNFQEEKGGAEKEDYLYAHHDPSSPDHVANKVAQWLFSSSYI